MQSLTSHTTSVSGGFKVIFSTQHRMFSVMLNVAMREREGEGGGVQFGTTTCIKNSA